MNPDFSKLIKSFSTIHYYDVNDIYINQDSIAVCGEFNEELIKKIIKRENKVIVILEEFLDENLGLLENPLITIICQKLKDYQRLLSYKSEDTLFINTEGL